MKRFVLCVLVASCNTQGHTEPAMVAYKEPAGVVGCAARPQDDCDAAITQIVEKKAPSKMTQKMLACAWLGLYLGACHPITPDPAPTPSTGGTTGVGGSTSGGTTSVDGKALCVASVIADPVRKQQASDSGLTVGALATVMCSSLQVQACYASGVCK